MREKKYFLAFILFMTLALIPVRAHAAEVVDSGTCGTSAKWSLDSEGTLTISGTTESAQGSVTQKPWIDEYRENVHKVVVGPGIKTLRSYIFYSHGNLVSVEIADGVESIGEYAFDYCTSLKDVRLPVTLKKIDSNIFVDCTSLTSLHIPKAVEDIDYLAFAGCSSLSAFTVDAANPNYMAADGVLFNKAGTTLVRYPTGRAGAYTVPSGVISINNGAFYTCGKVTAVSLPAGTVTIRKNAFRECTSLAGIEIPDSVNRIEDSAFWGCKKLTEFTIPSALNELAVSTFMGCDSLLRLGIPPTVTVIGNQAYGYDSDGNRNNDAVVAGITGSEAYIYAQERGISFVEDICVLGHTYDGGRILETPGQKKTGKIVYTCTVCKKSREEIVPALGESGNSGLISIRKTSVLKLTNIKGKKIKVKVSKVSGAAGYQIAYSTSKKFKKPVYKVSTKKTSCTIKKNLKKKKTYYVRARVYKKNSAGKKTYGEWSKAKKIKVRK